MMIWFGCMMSIERLKYTFSGHETFSCKGLWLKKGYDFLKEGHTFSDDDAVVALGVGKNMVASIRYWLRAFGIIEDNQPTHFGDYLFDDQHGKDKYMEDIATLWLLHFHLVFSQEATLYNLFFCDFQKGHTQFEREKVVSFVKLKMIEANKQHLFNENTVDKDVGVLIQNYALPRKAQSNDDFSSLLLDLDLICQESEGKGYFFNIEGKRNVTSEIFLYGLLVLKEQEGDNSIDYNTIQDRIGLVFCMQDYETIELLRTLAKDYPDYLSFTEEAGIRMVQFTKELSKEQVLNNYYNAHV